MSSTMSRGYRKRWLAGLAAAATMVLAVPGAAFGTDFGSNVTDIILPNSSYNEARYAPVFDYDSDGCYPASAITKQGVINPGLPATGSLGSDCRNYGQLLSTNMYSRYKCNHGWCVYMYAMYFEKDQALSGSEWFGHRNDWEHVAVWVKDGETTPRFVATSAHGAFDVHEASQVLFQNGTHPKVVYHKDGGSTHAFRKATWADEQPENARGVWHAPWLIGWNNWPSTALRDKLTSYDFGSATLAIRQDKFGDHINQAKPWTVPFDPWAAMDVRGW